MNTQKGFTLIEMLVVVLIIGILTSIAMPQYIKMVNKSRLAAVWQPMRMLQKAAMVCITEGKLSEGGGAGLDELQNLSSLACMDGFPSDSLKVHPKFNGISDADWDYFINYQGTVALGEQDKIFSGITRNGIYWCADRGIGDCEKLDFTVKANRDFINKYLDWLPLPNTVYREKKRD